ncbi:hypothetical protein HUJ05_008807 [Dendroctonus ponderosae]|nr:hypothetical protein HUJ05_008807 [Dendroctonus ponderosae]
MTGIIRKSYKNNGEKVLPRMEYLPGSNAEAEQLYREFQNNGDSQIADEPVNRLDTERQMVKRAFRAPFGSSGVL